MSMQKLSENLAFYITADQPVMLWGPPGIGKSDVVRQTCQSLGAQMIDLRLVLLEPTDLRGLPHVEDGSARWAKPEFLPDFPAHPLGVIFLDELTAADPSVQKAALQLVLDRQIGEYKLPEGWRIVCAGNRQQDRAGSFKMLSPLANRMAHLDVEPDVDSWIDWGLRNDLDPVIMAFLRYRQELLNGVEVPGTPAFPTPRSWAAAARNTTKLAFDRRPAFVESLVGEGPAAEYAAFARMALELPSVEQILQDPETAKMPDQMEAKPGLCYAVAVALSGAVNTTEEFEAALFYMRRIGIEEYATVFAFDAVKREPALRECKAYIDMAIGHAEALRH